MKIGHIYNPRDVPVELNGHARHEQLLGRRVRADESRTFRCVMRLDVNADSREAIAQVNANFCAVTKIEPNAEEMLCILGELPTGE